MQKKPFHADWREARPEYVIIMLNLGSAILKNIYGDGNGTASCQKPHKLIWIDDTYAWYASRNDENIYICETKKDDLVPNDWWKSTQITTSY